MKSRLRGVTADLLSSAEKSCEFDFAHHVPLAKSIVWFYLAQLGESLTVSLQ